MVAPPETNDRNSPVARLTDVRLTFGSTVALDDISVEIPAGLMIGLIGPDGVGKSSLLSLVSGARAIQKGKVEVLGGDMSHPRHREDTCPRIAYMPQGLGKNLYPTLSVFENIDFLAGCSDRTEGNGRRVSPNCSRAPASNLLPIVPR